MQKLLVLLNACWWITCSFALWNYSDRWPQQVVSTLVVLGVLSAGANLLFWVGRLLFQKPVFQTSSRWVLAFILLSTLSQAYLFISLLLS